eukprot:m.459484 g.459484  ORF g.459484 m.459484 type:complete len:63 (-) comp224607_c0_seq1:31-219(-)
MVTGLVMLFIPTHANKTTEETSSTNSTPLFAPRLTNPNGVRVWCTPLGCVVWCGDTQGGTSQ